MTIELADLKHGVDTAFAVLAGALLMVGWHLWPKYPNAGAMVVGAGVFCLSFNLAGWQQ